MSSAPAPALWCPPPAGYTLGPCIGGRPGVTLVFAAQDQRGQPCALKTLHPEAAAPDVRRARFREEITAHCAASGAPNVAAAHAPDSDGAWLAIAWAHGGDLAHAVERSAIVRARVAREADRIATSLLTCVAALNERGVIHRDIKPSNLLLDGAAVWLTDFGIAARQRSSTEWRALPEPFTEQTAGTPPWSAPELQNTPPACTPASDVFGVAMVWQWMLDFAGSGEHDHHEFGALLARMLHPQPHERPTAREALQHLRPRATETSDGTHPQS